MYTVCTQPPILTLIITLALANSPVQKAEEHKDPRKAGLWLLPVRTGLCAIPERLTSQKSQTAALSLAFQPLRIQKMMSKRVQRCEPGGGPQQTLTIQTGQYGGRPNLSCPRRQLDIFRRSATSSEHSAWIFPGEERRKSVSQLSHRSLPNNWAQGREDFPSILGGTCYLCFYVSNWFLINIK